jgi:hypothetical protein
VADPSPRKRRSNAVDASAVRGSITPRVWTPPLVELTPETSFGFDVIDFAEDIGMPLDPWEQWVMIHLGELLPDGRPRFRVVLILVARQNGKTYLSKVLSLYWLFIEQVPLVLGTSTNRDYAKAVWQELCDFATTNPLLSAELGPKPVWSAAGSEMLITAFGSRYKIAATNRRAGRSLTVHRLMLDELREHQHWAAWNAATNAMNAVPEGQVVAISNQGDDTSVVLDALHGPAMEYIETGAGDPRLGLFEWSAPRGADPTDLQALAMANPNLGYRIDPDSLVGAGIRAKRAGGQELAGFRTEVMCQRVHLLDPAVDPDAWAARGTDQPVDLALWRKRVALCVDVSLDGTHATLAAAAQLPNGRVTLEAVESWSGVGCAQALASDLPGIVAKLRPRVIGWFPAGPAAAVAADLADRGHRGWPPRRVVIEEIRGDVAAVCMGFAAAVDAGIVAHPNDPLLDQHVGAAQRLWRGDVWVFGRKGASPIDGAYAAAGAVHLARTLPPPPSDLVAI